MNSQQTVFHTAHRPSRWSNPTADDPFPVSCAPAKATMASFPWQGWRSEPKSDYIAAMSCRTHSSGRACLALLAEPRCIAPYR